MTQNSTLNRSAYEIGGFYRVPCIKSARYVAGHWSDVWGGEWIPVIGPGHRDADIIKFPHLHWHVDLRFVSARVFSRLASNSHGFSGQEYARPLQRWPAWDGKEDRAYTFIVGEGETTLRRRKCMRAFREYPRGRAFWMKELQEHCADLKMKNMVCPHRGIPLNGCRTEGDVVECPGHGLRWNVKTGELVR